MSAELFSNTPEDQSSDRAQKQLAIQVLEQITGIKNSDTSAEEYFPIDNINFVADSFLEKYIQYESEALDDSLDIDDESSDIDKLIERRLEAHRKLHSLIEIDDLVIVQGNFIGRVISFSNNTYVQFKNDVEIRGEFQSILVNDAPIVEELESLLKNKRQLKTGAKALEATYQPSEEIVGPSLVLSNPVFIHHLSNGKTDPEHTIDALLEIPLTHNKHISYQLLRESSLTSWYTNKVLTIRVSRVQREI